MYTKIIDPGKPTACIDVKNASFYKEVLLKGERGLGIAYEKGWWTTNHIDDVMDFFIKNILYFAPEASVGDKRYKKSLKNKSVKNDKNSIAKHYDIDNKFFASFLDNKFMAYSVGLFKNSDHTLENAINNKIDEILKQLDLKPGGHVLDIGCGWGLIANYVSKTSKSFVTGITVSDAQYDYSIDHKEKNVDIINIDYRQYKATHQYDGIYSIEMIEHVGKKNYVEFFETISDNLCIGGRAVIQCTVGTNEGKDCPQSNFVMDDIYESAEIPKISWIIEAVNRIPELRLRHMQLYDGINFNRTFQEWQKKISKNEDFQKELVRRFEYYFAIISAAFKANILASCVFTLEKCDDPFIACP
jgi:cyclopropane-fatty-acyl-phospholipid synthase